MHWGYVMFQVIALALPGLMIAYGLGSLIIDNSTDRDDDYSGTEGDDRIDAGNGDDLLDGIGGDDILIAGSGDDIAVGGEGNDIILGEQDEDTLIGGPGNDYIQGGDDNDALEGNSGDDWLQGLQGNDEILGGAGSDILLGEAGDDTLDGGAGADLLVGGSALSTAADLDDLTAIRSGTSVAEALEVDPDAILNLRDDNDRDSLSGGAGDDILVLGTGDTGLGGTGSDLFAILEDIGNEGPALIQDYNPAEDGLVVIVRDITNELDLSVQTQGDDALVFNGEMLLGRVANGAGQIDVSDLSIVAQSALTLPVANNG